MSAISFPSDGSISEAGQWRYPCVGVAFLLMVEEMGLHHVNNTDPIPEETINVGVCEKDWMIKVGGFLRSDAGLCQAEEVETSGFVFDSGQE
jgi:hypothetical protein